jgi:hypothetical protein
MTTELKPPVDHKIDGLEALESVDPFLKLSIKHYSFLIRGISIA